MSILTLNGDVIAIREKYCLDGGLEEVTEGHWGKWGQ